MQEIYTDVLVIGGGPAGCIAASMVHQSGLRVHVVEKEKFPRFVIGESLLPKCMEILEDAQFLEMLKKKNFQQKSGAKFLKGDEVADFNFSDQFSTGWSWTWQVPRADFDLCLSKELESKGVPFLFESTVSNIQFFEDETSVTTVERKDHTTLNIHARFVIDSSGYGRVIPRLLNLDKPSGLDPRKAIFAHVRDVHRNDFDEPNRIIVVLYKPDIWVWIIPFSNGNTSLGFVGDLNFLSTSKENLHEQFKTLIQAHPYLKKRFDNVTWLFEPCSLQAWSSKTERFFGKGFVLTGNATEFLDPIFSSGVMFAMVSSHLASKLVIKKLLKQDVDWDSEYTSIIQQGVDTFKSYVLAWYDGTLEKIFFSKNPDPVIRRQICSVLAGYVWDEKNPFVRNHDNALPKLARLIDLQQQQVN